MLPFPDCPLKQQLGLGQVRVDCLLRFIHVCCQKTIRKSSWNHVLRGCWTVGESQQHFPEEAPKFEPDLFTLCSHKGRLRLRVKMFIQNTLYQTGRPFKVLSVIYAG